MKDPILAIFMRTDLNMSRGKMAVQAGHAVAQTIYYQSGLDTGKILSQSVKEWMQNNQTKIVLAANSQDDLDKVARKAAKNNVSYDYVFDIGKTEVDPSTVTCLVVGIDSRHRINKLTSGWKALR